LVIPDTLGDSCVKNPGVGSASQNVTIGSSLPQVLPPRCCLRRVPCGNVGSYIAGSPNFFVRGPHELLHNSSRAEHLTWWDCFGICYILPSQQVIQVGFAYTRVAWLHWHSALYIAGNRMGDVTNLAIFSRSTAHHLASDFDTKHEPFLAYY